MQHGHTLSQWGDGMSGSPSLSITLLVASDNEANLHAPRPAAAPRRIGGGTGMNLLRRRTGRYGLALLAIALSALLRWLMPDVLSPGALPWILSGGGGGRGPGRDRAGTRWRPSARCCWSISSSAQFDLFDHGLQMRNLTWIIGSTGVSLLAGLMRARPPARRRAHPRSGGGQCRDAWLPAGGP